MFFRPNQTHTDLIRTWSKHIIGTVQPEIGSLSTDRLCSSWIRIITSNWWNPTFSIAVAIHNLPEDKTPPAIVRVFGIRVMNVLLCRQPKYTLATIRRASAAILHTLYTARDQPRHHSPVLRDEDRDCRQLQLNTGRAEGSASAAGAQSDQTSRGHAREVEESLLGNRESSPIDEHELKSHSNIRPPLLVSSATDSSPPGDTDGQTTGSGLGPVRDPATNVEEEKQKGETWQEFAQVLNILVSISYIVATIVTSAVFLWPLWFSEQKQLGS